MPPKTLMTKFVSKRFSGDEIKGTKFTFKIERFRSDDWDGIEALSTDAALEVKFLYIVETMDDNMKALLLGIIEFRGTRTVGEVNRLPSLAQAEVMKKPGLGCVFQKIKDVDGRKFQYGTTELTGRDKFLLLSIEEQNRIAPRAVEIFGIRYSARQVTGKGAYYTCNSWTCTGAVSFKLSKREEGFEHNIIDRDQPSFRKPHTTDCAQKRKLNDTDHINTDSIVMNIPYISRSFQDERKSNNKSISTGLLMLDRLVDERDVELRMAGAGDRTVIFSSIYEKSIKEGLDWGNICLIMIISTYLPLNWSSKYFDKEERVEDDLDKDLNALEEIVKRSTDSDLQDFNGSINGVCTHCMGRTPIEVAFKSEAARENGLNIVPRNSLPDQYQALHPHIIKGKISDGGYNWFSSVIEEQGSAVDSVKFSTKHNKVKREAFAEFTVCVVDVPPKMGMRNLFTKGLPRFHGTSQEMPVKRVYAVTCGPNGTFSENGAYIKLVRDNYDMKSEIFGKKWTIESMKVAEV